MDDSLLAVPVASPINHVNDGWQAHLQLAFACKQGRSYLADRRQCGPLVVQKTLHPEGQAVCHAIIVHPPGGVAGGDRLGLTVRMDPQANVLLTTPGAGKWYKANGREASQHFNFSLNESACLEWLPQETILYDGSQVALNTTVELAEQAVYAGWEILCFGRQASGERWQSGRLQQRLSIRRNGRMIWNEQIQLRPNARLMGSKAGLHGNAVSGGFVVAAGALPAAILQACRQLKADAGSRVGITAMPDIVSARYLGQSSQSARHYFESIWRVLRPWYAARAGVRPRIWST